MSEPIWICVRLGDVAEIIMGQAPAGDTVSDEGPGIPFLQGNAEFGVEHPTSKLFCTHPQKVCAPEDTLISVRAPVGALNIADQQYAIGRGLAAIRFKGINIAYGRHSLRLAISQLSKVAQGTTFAAVGSHELAGIKLEIPADEREQQRIAEILDSADEQIQLSINLIAKQKELRIAAIRQLTADGLRCFQGLEASELRKAPSRSAGSWSLVPLGSLLTGIDAGNSPDLEDTPAGHGQWGVLKVSAVGEDGFCFEENKVVHYEGLHDPAICVHPGDLLMTRANTSQLVGRTCIVGDTPAGLMLSDKILRLRVAGGDSVTRYLHIEGYAKPVIASLFELNIGIRSAMR